MIPTLLNMLKPAARNKMSPYPSFGHNTFFIFVWMELKLFFSRSFQAISAYKKRGSNLGFIYSGMAM